jgi:hypothetical protein
VRWLKRVHQLCQASLLPIPFVTRPNLPSLRTAFLASALIVSGVPQAHGAWGAPETTKTDVRRAARRCGMGGGDVIHGIKQMGCLLTHPGRAFVN